MDAEVEIGQELDELAARYTGALARQDVEGLVACYAEDAQFLIPGAPILRGREAVANYMRAWVKDGPVRVRFERRDVQADGAIVVEVGEIVGPSGPRSKYVVVYRRQPDGSLQIAVDSSSSLGEQPPAKEAAG